MRIDARLLGPLILVLALGAGPKLAAFDWGGGTEDKTGTSVPFKGVSAGTFDQTETFRFWLSQYFNASDSLLLKANMANVSTVGYSPGNLANSFTADLDVLAFSTPGWVIGRTNYRDMGNTLLNTTLDGAQYTLDTPNFDLVALAGYSGFVFKSGSTIVISQSDLNARTIPENFLKPSTLFAPSRAVGYVEADFAHLLPEQKLMVAEAVQIDLTTSGLAKNGDTQTSNASATAPVHMSYTGLGMSGRIVGPLYWDIWGYAGLGTSLTLVGPTKSQTWKNSYIVNGIGNFDLTLLLPNVNNLVVDLGFMMGSWDKDGISPGQNQPTSTQGKTPSLYTGYVGISRTGSALIFNPQPVNMAITQLLVSIKPFADSTSDLANLAVAMSAFVFVRPTSGPIAEAGIDPTKNALYVASEGDVNLLWRPASDWGLNLGVGVFVPGPAMTRGVEMRLQLGANVSF